MCLINLLHGWFSVCLMFIMEQLCFDIVKEAVYIYIFCVYVWVVLFIRFHLAYGGCYGSNKDLFPSCTRNCTISHSAYPSV